MPEIRTTGSPDARIWIASSPVSSLAISRACWPLEGGTLDLLRTGAIPDVARLKKDPNYQVLVHPSSGTFYEMAFLTTVKPFDNKLVRQAFNWAIDRQRNATQVFQGFADPVSLQWSPSSPAYDAEKNKTYSFNLDKAKSLLQQAGVSGLQTDVIVTAASPVNALGFLQIYQADLASIGVTLNIKTYDPATWAGNVLGHTYNAMYATGDVVANLLPINNLNGPTWRPNPNNTEWDAPEWKDDRRPGGDRAGSGETENAVCADERLHSRPVMGHAVRHQPADPGRGDQTQRRNHQPVRRVVLHRRLAGRLGSGCS